MSLLNDIESALDGDYFVGDINTLDDVTLMSDEYQGSGRWAEYWVAVFNRRTHNVEEYVAVEYSRPAPDYQGVDSKFDDIYEVEPVVVKTVTYARKN